ncbi:MAG: hypothetical protein AAGC43_04550 [Bacteroidota bacterium]
MEKEIHILRALLKEAYENGILDLSEVGKVAGALFKIEAHFKNCLTLNDERNV